MRKNTKRGFTIVELVIVIAVIGILSAVLIPTFGKLVNNAKIASDQSLVRNINNQLEILEVQVGKNSTMHEALADAHDAGYLVANINAKSNGNELVWDQTLDRFALIESETGKVIAGEVANINNKVALWRISDTYSSADGYSIYLRDGYSGSESIENVSTGIDVGTNTNVSHISYVSSVGQTVTIRTNGGTLTIDAPSDIVNHHGYAEVLDVQAVDYEHSYHEFGTSGFARIAKGHFVVESTGAVNVLYATGTKTGASKVKVDNNNGIVGKAFATDESVANQEGTKPKQDGNIILVKDESVTAEVVEAVTSSNIAEAVSTNETLKEVVDNSAFRTETDANNITWNLISSINEFIVFRNKVNSATSSDPILTGYFKLTSDIDLHSEVNWTPISLSSNTYSFRGTFDGGDKAIRNLTITGNDGYRGLFGKITGGTIKNVKLENASVEGSERVGGLVGRVAGSAVIDHCSIDSSSKVTGNSSNTGGLIAEINCDADVTISNCVNSATVTNKASSDSRAGGVVGQATGNSTHLFTFDSCENNGTVKSNKYVGGILCSLNGNDMVATFTNCTNDYSKLNATYKGNMFGWSQNGHNNRTQPITISGYTGSLDQMVGYFSAPNYSFQYFNVNGSEYMFRNTTGVAGSVIFGQTATVISKAYHAKMDEYWNWVHENHGASFAGSVNISDYDWFNLGLGSTAQNAGGYFGYGGTTWYLTHSPSSNEPIGGYNENHVGHELSIEDFRVTWTSNVLYVLGE